MRTTAALTFAHKLLARTLGPGRVAVDATAGNGNDALALAGLVAPDGVVHCFDIQAEALEKTRKRLEAAGLGHLARYHAAGHEAMLSRLPRAHHGRVAAAVFNLGFLPGGDEAVITRPKTTLAALDAASAVLAPDGGIAVVCYTGHPGGADETEAVAAWCVNLPFHAWRAARYELVNKPGCPIIAFFVERRSET
ncbi:putative rRNA methylase [Solidesulfovibrio fructosivorans JJ]]|uniref:Putative rRNA methylase n=1 Tax=Solidesulfovibrio fructosivorans JJ] TaxID=596151 RepID=E1JTP1_SOLFR|nr:class I SAM-dependent methyltransferase [Solidesulfovibrio fructosivorans]EFL52170.1 putative rRNA methylase [Solidesulfovibrio fructosivorans JJ]]